AAWMERHPVECLLSARPAGRCVGASRPCGNNVEAVFPERHDIKPRTRGATYGERESLGHHGPPTEGGAVSDTPARIDRQGCMRTDNLETTALLLPRHRTRRAPGCGLDD